MKNTAQRSTYASDAPIYDEYTRRRRSDTVRGEGLFPNDEKQQSYHGNNLGNKGNDNRRFDNAILFVEHEHCLT
jgi:hypothetical protein